MNIVVCMKQVPKTEFELEIADSKTCLKEDNLIFDINEFDDYALEAALQLKEQLSGEVVAVTVGPDRAREILYLALAKGADRAIHINDPILADMDVNVAAEVLARAIRGIQYDLILTGVESTDDASAQTGVLMAEKLGLPHATVVTKIAVQKGDNRIRVSRELGGGELQVVELPLPAALTVQLGIYKLRYASLRGIAKARQKEMKQITASDLKLTSEELAKQPVKQKLLELSFPPKTKKAQILQGEPEEIAKTLVEKLRTEAKVV